METFFLKTENIFRFYDRIAQQFELYLPQRIPGRNSGQRACSPEFPTDDYILARYSDISKDEVLFSEYRSLEPVARAAFTHAKEEICSYFSGARPSEEELKPRAIAGVKNCDLFALKIQDYVFLEGLDADPLYRQRRENALIIAGDCPSFKETCFCRAFEINPFPQEGFDFNLSLLTNGYLLDVAGERAKGIAASLKEILVPATLSQLSGRSTKRESVVRRMEEHLKPQAIPKKEVLQDIVLSGFDSNIWREQSQTCVECAGCIFDCDTCHCFLLSDEPQGEGSRRVRSWDGCLLKNFSRVAGGANPLKLRHMRLRNRYLKKFDFFISNLGYQACCGCGRCIEVCPGKIDIRKILRLLDESRTLNEGAAKDKGAG